jgi:hypothetical protein
VIYEDDRIRDHGLVVPMNVEMRARVASASVALGDRAGVPLSAEGVSFQITEADVTAASAAPSRLSWMSPRRTDKFLKVYTTGRK